MLTVEITGPRQVALTERPDPRPVDDLAVVRVECTPMCTEYKAYRGDWQSALLGHEAAGVVEAVAQPGKVEPGDRVVVMPQYPCGKCALCLAGDYIYCQHCPDVAAILGGPWGTATYAQRLVKQDWLLVPIPDDLSTEHAAMACCGLGPTFGALDAMSVGAFDTVLVTGLGPVGLGGVVNATFRGARVIGVEGNPYRASLARDLGAEEVVDAADDGALKRIMALTGGVGVDAAVDCSGSPQAQRLMVSAARRRGRVAFVGEGGDVALHVSNDLLRKGLTIYGQWHYNLSDTPRIWQVVRANQAKLDKLITHRFPMSRVADAFELQLTGQCGKVVLDPWQ